VPTDQLAAAVEAAGRAVPPVWPLASSVAVNPFLGQTGERLADVAARLGRIGAIPVTMPRSWYLERVRAGAITNADLEAALAACRDEPRPDSVAALLAAAEAPASAPVALPTVADLAADATGVDWPGLIVERFGAWAAGYFDVGQALWSAPRTPGAWTAWRSVATHDLTPEIQGLAGFAARVANTPDAAAPAIAEAVATLGLPAEALETYFHALLASLGGWSQVARYRLWQAELDGGSDATLEAFLAIRLTWEAALYEAQRDRLGARWQQVAAAHAEPLAATPEQIVDVILQEALERATQRELFDSVAAPVSSAALLSDERPRLQAAFCIDVRSEVFRRALEGIDPGIRTLGFAGFFGIGTSHRRFASDVEEARLPVLLKAGLSSVSGGAAQAETDLDKRYAARAARAWGRFKFAAVSSFAFVEASAPLYVGKLLREALGFAPRQRPLDPLPRLDPEPELGARIDAAETVLRAMSLTENFAPIVMLAGHGASVVNNPHASALHCGACGGYSGEVNARLLAGLLNDTEVRGGLTARGIVIPGDTLFIGALHDTTTDEVLLYEDDQPTVGHGEGLRRLRDWLASAGSIARGERALRLPRAASERAVARRSRDWAEVRPEWALAGCRAFIAAPRKRSFGVDLSGRAFLHDYDWQADSSFSVLELILTAPVVVASWISLQYYGSTVAPETFGAGNKLLHNVTGGMGVVEGNGGRLRVGLPWQSVHDGADFVHEPVRLSVFVQAPQQAVNDILERHPGVRALFDNGWLKLFRLEDESAAIWRYEGDLVWAPARGEAVADAGDTASATSEAVRAVGT
jgi:uncharacterized protein YbcC (UPF0753/DUF2309 family)